MKRIALFLSMLAGVLALAMIDRTRPARPAWAWMVTLTVTDLDRRQAAELSRELSDAFGEEFPMQSFVRISEDHHV